jgi:predicted transcriptional regulator
MHELPDHERLREELWELNMLNREAAEYLGVVERTVYSYLSGERRVPKMLWLALELRRRELRNKNFFDLANELAKQVV